MDGLLANTNINIIDENENRKYNENLTKCVRRQTNIVLEHHVMLSIKFETINKNL